MFDNEPFLANEPPCDICCFITAMTTIHVKAHAGNSISGKSLSKADTRKTASAMVSNREPDALAEFVFLATVPSIISVMPLARYIA